MVRRTDRNRTKPVIRLAPELVPEPLWHISGYHLLTRGAWKSIRARVLAKSKGACAICGAVQEKGMVCHEVWHYQGSERIATLASLRLICPDCNRVHHIGMTQLLMPERYEPTIRHMARVNGLPTAIAREFVERAFEVWRRRSATQWRTAIAPRLKRRFPQLAVAAGRIEKPRAGARRVRARSGQPW